MSAVGRPPKAEKALLPQGVPDASDERPKAELLAALERVLSFRARESQAEAADPAPATPKSS